VHTRSFLGENALPEVGNFYVARSINITPEIEADFNNKGIAIDTHHQRGGEKLCEVLPKVVESWYFGPVPVSSRENC
jgi:hypothetical protein